MSDVNPNSQQLAAEVLTSETQMRLVLDALPVLVSFVSATETYRFVNKAYEDWFGIPREQVLGRTLQEVIGPLAYERLAPYVRRGLAGELFSFEQYGVPYRLGGKRDVKATFVPHWGPTGTVDGYVALLEDVTEQRRLQAERDLLTLQRTEVLESMGDAFFGLSADWRVLFVNRVFERISHKTREQLLGGVFWDLFPQAKDPASVYWQNYRRCMAERCDVEFTILTSAQAWLEVRAYPTANRGIAVFCRDVTRQARADEALRQQAIERSRLLSEAREAGKRAAEASRTKDEFLATASHELRTPLNAIMGWAHLLHGGQLDASTVLRGAEVIERNAKAQVRLIEDILDGSRIITGKLSLETRALDMTALVRAALEAVRPAADAKTIQLSMHLDPNAARVVGDPDRLQQIVWNLAVNAVKFTPKGGAVEVRLTRSGTWVELAVCDTGQGISKEFLPHVFERFLQAEGSTTRRHGGLGLGLALVRHLVEAHGGTVRAESEGEGRGARFFVLLPVQAVYESSVPSERPARSLVAALSASGVPSLHGSTLLVVDDEADSRELVATVLRAQGAEVIVAASALSALELLTEHTPTLMISDVGMPGVDGYELVRLARAQGVTVPAIALTAYSREQDRRLALEAGFQTHVSKPVEPLELVRVVAGLVHFIGRQSSPAQREFALQRADTFVKFEKILASQSTHDALRFLNSRTPHRFTGIYRFDAQDLRNLLLVDSFTPDLRKGTDAPRDETYCSIVGETERPFATEDTRYDERLRTHPARENVVSYCGVLLRDSSGRPFGTLCHFDLVPCDIPISEIPLLEAAAPLLMQAIQRDLAATFAGT